MHGDGALQPGVTGGVRAGGAGREVLEATRVKALPPAVVRTLADLHDLARLANGDTASVELVDASK